MSEEAKTEKAPAEAPAAHASGGGGGGGGNKLVLILSAVNLLAVLGMGAVLFISFQKEKTNPPSRILQQKKAASMGQPLARTVAVVSMEHLRLLVTGGAVANTVAAEATAVVSTAAVQKSINPMLAQLLIWNNLL